jgi:hypothetical protein
MPAVQRSDADVADQDDTMQASPPDEPETTSVDCTTSADQTLLAWSDVHDGVDQHNWGHVT